jgi:hypothetical protein
MVLAKNAKILAIPAAFSPQFSPIQANPGKL